jgi:hypothetical protein
MSDDLTENEQKLVAGTLWDEFCDFLKYAGATLRRDGSPKDLQSQAEGHPLPHPPDPRCARDFRRER